MIHGPQGDLYTTSLFHHKRTGNDFYNRLLSKWETLFVCIDDTHQGPWTVEEYKEKKRITCSIYIRKYKETPLTPRGR